jgi:cytochrome c oxidase accessory protein FixG
LGSWRRVFQWLTSLLVIAVPFVEISGNSLLRLDFPTLTMHLGGAVFPIEALWLFLLAGLLLVLLFLLVTLALGRAWCGWACPQTTLVDLVEWCARRLGVKVAAGTLTAAPWQKALLQLLYLGLAGLVGANLLWYFVAPTDFIAHLAAGTLHWSAWALCGTTAAVVYLDLAFLRRLFCKEFCPYGRFQTVLVDPGTLTLRYHPDEAPRCIRCGACVRACPTGIDIRRGYQIECINCGRCLDACREVMARRGQPGIIRYTFGLEGHGARALLNPRMALVALATLVVTAGLIAATVQRPTLTLKIARNAQLLPRATPDGGVINFYSAYLVNQTDCPQTVRFRVSTGPAGVQWRGAVEPLQLAPGEHRRIDFGLEAGDTALLASRDVMVALLDAAGDERATAAVILTPPLDKTGPNRSE